MDSKVDSIDGQHDPVGANEPLCGQQHGQHDDAVHSAAALNDGRAAVEGMKQHGFLSRSARG